MPRIEYVPKTFTPNSRAIIRRANEAAAHAGQLDRIEQLADDLEQEAAAASLRDLSLAGTGEVERLRTIARRIRAAIHPGTDHEGHR